MSFCRQPRMASETKARLKTGMDQLGHKVSRPNDIMAYTYYCFENVQCPFTKSLVIRKNSFK